MVVRLLELTFIAALCSACSPERQERVGDSIELSGTPATGSSALIATLGAPEVFSTAPVCLEDPSSFVAVSQGVQTAIHAGAPVGTRYVKSETEGEGDLTAEARTARVEDAWVFLPESALWIDVGEQEKPRSVMTNLDPLQTLALPSSESVSRALLYHIHPRSMHGGDPICPPDGLDIYAAATLKRAFRDRYGVTLASRILDGSGRWSYDISPELEDWLRLPDYSGSEVRWIEYSEVRPYYSGSRLMMDRRDEFLGQLDRGTVDFFGGRNPLPGARIHAFIQAARANGIIVSYAEM